MTWVTLRPQTRLAWERVNATSLYFEPVFMGAPMARRLLRAGHRVTVFNRTRARAQALAGDGAVVADSPAVAVRGAEVVFTMVPDTPDVEDVVEQMAPALEPGRMLVDMSTVAPAGARRIAEQPRRAAGRLPRRAGIGRRDRRNRRHFDHHGGWQPHKRLTARARFSISSANASLICNILSGSGQMTKLVNQVAVAVNLEAQWLRRCFWRSAAGTGSGAHT